MIVERQTRAARPITAAAAMTGTDDADGHLIGLWLHGRPANTRRAYGGDVAAFRAALGKPLAAATLADLQRFADALDGRAANSRYRTLAAIKSLYGFARRTGYLAFDVAAAVRLPARPAGRSERILSDGEVARLLAAAPNGRNGARNQALLRLLYGAGLRAAEATALRVRDAQPRAAGAGQITVLGKGGRDRTIFLPAPLWRDLAALITANPDDPVFRSRRGGALHTSQVFRIVRAAAARAGLAQAVSPHWLRHAHASHALERGAPIHLVQHTLGHGSIATTGIYLHSRPDQSSADYVMAARVTDNL